MRFPPIQPYQQGYLDVSPDHSIYVEQSGSPTGTPILRLHGGGGANLAYHRQLFDPSIYRIILFDQRGCGRSRFRGDYLADNTTQRTIEDIEAIRRALGIEAFVLTGSSYWATLALAYAEEYPRHVSRLVLAHLLLGERSETRWAYQEGASRFFPAEFARYRDQVPEPERSDLLGFYYRQIVEQGSLRAATSFKSWQRCLLSISRRGDLAVPAGEVDYFLRINRVALHFLWHGMFLEPGQLVDNVRRIRRIPTFVVHGRFDLLAPPLGVHRLCEAHGDARLIIVPTAGHGSDDPGFADALDECYHPRAPLARGGEAP